MSLCAVLQLYHHPADTISSSTLFPFPNLLSSFRYRRFHDSFSPGITSSNMSLSLRALSLQASRRFSSASQTSTARESLVDSRWSLHVARVSSIIGSWRPIDSKAVDNFKSFRAVVDLNRGVDEIDNRGDAADHFETGHN
jgi:hypothetical protein